MNDSTRTTTAGEREVGVPCAHCGRPIQLGQTTAICQQCGTLHHESCWQEKPRCGGYECATTADLATAGGQPALLITRDELAAAVPLPGRSAANADVADNRFGREPPRRWNRVGVWAFIVSLLGIP